MAHIAQPQAIDYVASKVRRPDSVLHNEIGQDGEHRGGEGQTFYKELAEFQMGAFAGSE